MAVIVVELLAAAAAAASTSSPGVTAAATGMIGVHFMLLNKARLLTCIPRHTRPLPDRTHGKRKLIEKSERDKQNESRLDVAR